MSRYATSALFSNAFMPLINHLRCVILENQLKQEYTIEPANEFGCMVGSIPLTNFPASFYWCIENFCGDRSSNGWMGSG